ncbi:MAG TPA: hypothetical protein VLJ84_05375 [Usitatibacter sp.]|nr:hypothetical protein [Usitatibacter sp.]
MEMVHVHLVSSLIDPYSWKWVVLSLHHAVHAFLSASFEEGRAEEAGWGERGLRPSSEESWIEATPPADSTDAEGGTTLTTLYGRAKSTLGFRPSEIVDVDLKRLAFGRAVLLDRLPARWRISVRELPRISRSGMGLIEYLGWSPGRISWGRESMLQLARTKHHASMRILGAAEQAHN